MGGRFIMARRPSPCGEFGHNARSLLERRRLPNPLAHSSAAAGHQCDLSSEHPPLSHLDLFARLAQASTDSGNFRCVAPSPTSAAMTRIGGRAVRPDRSGTDAPGR
jgi:hypothetical protein